MTAEVQAKREELKALSIAAKAYQQIDEDLTINDILIEKIYKDHEHREFHTLRGWNKKGMRVKKGMKAFLIWGKPKGKADQQEEKKEDEAEKSGKFFPIAYLFSNAQVEPYKKAAQ